MSCPHCQCKEVYAYDHDEAPSDGYLQRCAACGQIFDIEDHLDDEDDVDESVAEINHLKHQVQQTFTKLIETDTTAALQLVTGMFVSLTLEIVRRQGSPMDMDIKIEGGGERRDITIHKPT